MSWTDERIETLRRLWLEGSSASQIAKQLSDGMTRNAVIGKVHRLGLSGRVKPLQSSKEASPETRTSVRPPSANGSQQIIVPRQVRAQQERHNHPHHQTIPLTHGNNALSYDLDVIEVERPARVQIALDDVVIPISERVTIMELRDSMCRWPMGDPALPEFRYCGTRIAAVGEGSYCAHHSRIAYQPNHERRRERRLQRAG